MANHSLVESRCNGSGLQYTVTDDTLEDVVYYINIFRISVILPLGIICNLLSYFILRRPALMKIGITSYLRALAVTDALCVIVSALFTMQRMGAFEATDWTCKCMLYLLYITINCSDILVACFAMERAYSVISPLQHRTKTFKRNIIIPTVILSQVALYMEVWWTAMIDCDDKYDCMRDRTYTILVKSTPIIASILHGLIFTSITISCFIIAISLCRQSRTAPQRVSGEAKDRHTSIVMLSVVLLYVLTASPVIIVSIVRFVAGRKFPIILNVDVMQIAHTLMCLNHTLNAFIYYFSWPIFRKEIAAVLESYFN